MNTAYVTTVCHGDGYVPGVEALGMSLQASGAKHPLVVMVTPDVTEEGRQRLTRTSRTPAKPRPLSA